MNESPNKKSKKDENVNILSDFKINIHKLPVASFVTTLKGRIESWNPRAEDVFNIESVDVIGALISDIFSFEQNYESFNAIFEQSKKKGFWQGEIVCSVKSKELIFSTWYTQKYFDSEKNETLIGFFILNPQEHFDRRNEMKIYKQAAEQSIDGIAMADMNGNIRFVNKAWARMHGYYNKGELIGRHLKIFHTPHQMVEDVISFNEIVSEKGFNSGEVGHQRKDGSTFPTFMSTTVIVDEENQPVGLVGIARDITELMRSRNELFRVRNSLESMVHARTEDLRKTNEKLKLQISEKEKIGSALKKSLKSASDIINSIPSALFTYQFLPPDKLIFIDANPEAIRMTNLDMEASKGLEFDQLWPTAKELGLTKTFLEVMQIDRPYSADDFQYIDNQIDGVYRIRAFKLAGDRLCVAVEDISKWKKAEKALQESEALFRSIFSNAVDGILVEALDGTIIDVNPATCQMLGFEKEEIIGMNVSALVPEEVADMIPEIIDELVKKGSARFENYNVRKDGTLVPVEVNLNSIFINGEHRVAAIIRDIRERKRTDERLIESEQKFRTLFELSSDGVLLCDAQSQIVIDVNQTACRLFDKPKEEIIGSNLRTICTKDNADHCISQIFESAEKGKAIGEYFEIPNNFGKITSVSVAASRLEIEEQQILQVVFRDMTTRMKLENQLVQKAEEVKLLNDILIHDIANINQAALSYNNLIASAENGTLSKAQEMYVNKCHQQLNRVTSVLDKVAMISMAASDLEKSFSLLDLSDVVSQAIKTIIAHSHDREIKIDFTPEKGKKVLADRLLQQLFYNLLENGIKHNNNKVPYIQVSIKEQVFKERPCWAVAFEDNGAGIKNHHKEMVFDRFNAKGTGRGTGLGLSIVKALASYYEGDVIIQDRVEEREDQGSRFTVLLPKG